MFNGNPDKFFIPLNGSVWDLRLEVTVFDNGGTTLDRYTVLFQRDGGYGFDMSHNPESPSGVCLYTNVSEGDCYRAKLVEILYADLPEAVKAKTRELYQLYIEEYYPDPDDEEVA